MIQTHFAFNIRLEIIWQEFKWPASTLFIDFYLFFRFFAYVIESLNQFATKSNYIHIKMQKMLLQIWLE